MNLLLDTHILLWSVLTPGKLTLKVKEALATSANQVWISPISTWEVLILSEKRKIVLKPDTLTWLRNILVRIPHREAVLNHEIAIESRFSSLPHCDPADRFLVATAKVYDLTLITADQRLIRHAKVSVMANKQS